MAEINLRRVFGMGLLLAAIVVQLSFLAAHGVLVASIVMGGQIAVSVALVIATNRWPHLAGTRGPLGLRVGYGAAALSAIFMLVGLAVRSPGASLGLLWIASALILGCVSVLIFAKVPVAPHSVVESPWIPVSRIVVVAASIVLLAGLYHAPLFDFSLVVTAALSFFGAVLFALGLRRTRVKASSTGLAAACALAAVLAASRFSVAAGAAFGVAAVLALLTLRRMVQVAGQSDEP